MATTADDELLIDNEVLFPSSEAGPSSDGHQESNKYPLSHPNHILQKALALTLMCIIGLGDTACEILSIIPEYLSAQIMKFFEFVIGSYFCYDNPAALQDYFIKDMGLNTSQFVLLYSWYSWPNVILCFIGGFLMDR